MSAMPTMEEQIRRLRLVDPTAEITVPVGYIDVVTLQLPNGDEVVSADPEGTYDIWRDDHIVVTGLWLGQIQILMRGENR